MLLLDCCLLSFCFTLSKGRGLFTLIVYKNFYWEEEKVKYICIHDTALRKQYLSLSMRRSRAFFTSWLQYTDTRSQTAKPPGKETIPIFNEYRWSDCVVFDGELKINKKSPVGYSQTTTHCSGRVKTLICMALSYAVYFRFKQEGTSRQPHLTACDSHSCDQI